MLDEKIVRGRGAPTPLFMTTDLEQLVSETIDITGAAPPAMLDEDAPVLSERTLAARDDDAIYLVGLIGGKDVGKSSLVNALVGESITAATSHGPGTDRVIAYAHASAAAHVRTLLDRELPGQFQIIVHSNDSLRRQVLLDLPDIDSRWSDHMQITRRMLRHILFPIWIQSIEKYADHVPQQLLSKVAAGNDPTNFIFCLNKIDQLLEREGPQALKELQEDYARRMARNLSLSKRPQVYLISAIQPDEADLPSLRKLLSREKSLEDVRQSQDLAVRRKDRSLLAWLDMQGLEQRVESLARLERETEEMIASRIGTQLVEQAIPRLLDDPAQRAALLEPAVQKRLSRWPIINILDTLLSPLIALLHKNLSSSALGAGRALDLYLDSGGRSVSSLIQSTFAHLYQSHPLIGALYHHHKLWESLPAETAAAELRQRLSVTLDRQRDAVITRVAGRFGIIRPLFRWTLTIGALLWFPFVQPLLEAFLAPGIGKTTRELIYLGVQMIGVTYLLRNVTFLLIWFFVLWLILRWSTHRRLARMIERWKSSTDVSDPLSLNTQVLEWMDELVEPIRRHRERIESILRRAEQLRAGLHRSAA